LAASPNRFSVDATDGLARTGNLLTGHGSLPTPAFMAVGTQGSVKTLDPVDLTGAGTQIVLGNTYHLYLRPGLEVIEAHGGLHGFMAWDGPILTDSGGFQGFSLERLRKINDDGIVFTSHIDGSQHAFTPESVVSHQERLGSDIAMPLDWCAALPAKRDALAEAVEKTTRWAERTAAARTCSEQAVFGIVQGGTEPDLRERSAREITGLGFDGYAIGGLSVGETKADMYRITESTVDMLPQDRPRYLMGVGSPEDLVECVSLGIDMFDCVLPTRVARNGSLYTADGRVNILAAKYRTMDSPLDENCDCYACRNFTAAYLSHLFRAKEVLALRLGSIHNLRFVLRLMEELRAAITGGQLVAYREAFLARYAPADEGVRQAQRKRWLASQGRGQGRS
jgi:queuine tRNA-ribosyltransferase